MVSSDGLEIVSVPDKRSFVAFPLTTALSRWPARLYRHGVTWLFSSPCPADGSRLTLQGIFQVRPDILGQIPSKTELLAKDEQATGR